MRYLLDTNILSALARDPHGRVRARIVAAGPHEVATSIVVAAELRFGVALKGSTRLGGQIDAILGLMPVLPLEDPVDRIYGGLRATLHTSGRPIGANDLWIAAQALALDLTMVTDNEAEFRRVEGLAVENWLRER